MPLIRVDLMQGKSAEYRQRVGDAVHEALLKIGVPPNDRFQIITDHPPGGIVYDPSYLGIERTDGLIIIQITLNEGRSLELKKLLFASIAEQLEKTLAVRQQDVLINLVEVKKENWSFGNGVAQYAQ
jgi:phenylpyruvate tautomerase PptA (4-oxalocrotonate tautomerase family)